MPATKTSKTAKKQNKAQKAPEAKLMTFGQVKCLAAALFHAGWTKAKLSQIIDKAQEGLSKKPENAMPEDKKAEWLKAHGDEKASWGQCMMYAMTLKECGKTYDAISQVIEKLDQATGYVKEPKKEVAKA